MVNGTATALRSVTAKKAPMQYRICDLTNERQCWSALRSQTSSTTTHFRWIVRRISSEIDASLYQVLQPFRIVQQSQGQKVFEAWHVIVRRHDQRNMSDKNSALALISNFIERDRAQDVFGKIRKEKMRAVKKLMPESSLNRFR